MQGGRRVALCDSAYLYTQTLRRASPVRAAGTTKAGQLSRGSRGPSARLTLPSQKPAPTYPSAPPPSLPSHSLASLGIRDQGQVCIPPAPVFCTRFFLPVLSPGPPLFCFFLPWVVEATVFLPALPPEGAIPPGLFFSLAPLDRAKSRAECC